MANRGISTTLLGLLALSGACSKDLEKTGKSDVSGNALDVNNLAGKGDFYVGGWNAGFKFRRAMTHLGDALFFESCPDAPGESCKKLGRGNGFFTLAHGIEPSHTTDGNNCKINSRSLFSPRSAFNAAETSTNPNVSCPYFFHWGVNQKEGSDKGKNFARIEVDTSKFTSQVTPNIYLGLQENFIGKRAEYLLGLDPSNPEHAPRAELVHSRRFKARTKVCRGNAAADPYLTARFIHYANFTRYGSEGKVVGHKSIALNFQKVVHKPPLPDSM
jgi:hypothetical protein